MAAGKYVPSNNNDDGFDRNNKSFEEDMDDDDEDGDYEDEEEGKGGKGRKRDRFDRMLDIVRMSPRRRRQSKDGKGEGG